MSCFNQQIKHSGSNMGCFFPTNFFNNTQPFSDIDITHCTKKAFYFLSICTSIYLAYKLSFRTTFSQTPGSVSFQLLGPATSITPSLILVRHENFTSRFYVAVSPSAQFGASLLAFGRLICGVIWSEFQLYTLYVVYSVCSATSTSRQRILLDVCSRCVNNWLSSYQRPIFWPVL
jgi:hypothetical protein